MRVRKRLLEKHIRWEFGDITQREIARALGVSTTTVNKILNRTEEFYSDKLIAQIADKIGRRPGEYRVAPVNFQNVYAYDMPNRFTYIGKSTENGLEEAYRIQTTTVERKSRESELDTKEALRELYSEAWHDGITIARVDFNSHEAVAVFDLGEL